MTRWFGFAQGRDAGHGCRIPVAGVLALSLLMPLSAMIPAIVPDFLMSRVQAEGEDDPLWNRPSFEHKVVQVGQRILMANGVNEYVAFTVRDTAVKNAYANQASGNEVFIYSGLLHYLTSDDELAAVLSHEIAHILMRHQHREAVHNIPQGILIGILAGLTVNTPNQPSPQQFGQLYQMSTAPGTRKFESEADIVGVDYMVHAGYNPLAMESMLAKISGDDVTWDRIWLDHPAGHDRLDKVRKHIQEKYPQYLTADALSHPPGMMYPIKALPKGEVPSLSKNMVYTPAPKKPVVAQPGAGSAIPSGMTTVIHPPAEKSASVPAVATTPVALAGNNTPDNPAVKEAMTVLAFIPPAAAAPAANPVRVSGAESQVQIPASQKMPDRQNQNQLQSRNQPEQTKLLSLAAAPAVSPGIISAQPQPTVAQMLLTLSPDELKVLTAISKRGYLENTDLDLVLGTISDAARDSVIQHLEDKQLIRVVGSEPRVGYVLTDRAAKELNPKP